MSKNKYSYYTFNFIFMGSKCCGWKLDLTCPKPGS